MKRTAIVLLALAAGLAGCGWVTGPNMNRTEEGFSAIAGRSALILRNESPHPVHYVALEEETSHRVDLNPNPAEWRSVQPGAEVSIAYAELDGYHPGADWAVVHWWSQGASGRLRVALR
ncbi:hypothetical protein [Longimicrobium sp.]|jgi:hypothetical protein|uniref:hypothetical protein n=1 Tax=Longimicrobium sp. TaxID=2029185 RepID=UPI002F92627D